MTIAYSVGPSDLELVFAVISGGVVHALAAKAVGEAEGVGRRVEAGTDDNEAALRLVELFFGGGLHNHTVGTKVSLDLCHHDTAEAVGRRGGGVGRGGGSRVCASTQPSTWLRAPFTADIVALILALILVLPQP